MMGRCRERDKCLPASVYVSVCECVSARRHIRREWSQSIGKVNSRQVRVTTEPVRLFFFFFQWHLQHSLGKVVVVVVVDGSGGGGSGSGGQICQDSSIKANWRTGKCESI